MAITDYIPNIFGQAAPSYLPGLLGAEETQNLQNRANVQGLLGAGLALAQGMSRTGPRRSAAENILGSIAGGFGAAGGAYDQGIKNYVTQQQIAQTQLAQQDALLKRQQTLARLRAIEQASKDNPQLAQLFAINPEEASKQLLLQRRAERYQSLLGETPPSSQQAPMAGQVDAAQVANVNQAITPSTNLSTVSQPPVTPTTAVPTPSGQTNQNIQLVDPANVQKATGYRNAAKVATLEGDIPTANFYNAEANRIDPPEAITFRDGMAFSSKRGILGRFTETIRLTTEQAKAEGLPTDQGQVWQKSPDNKISQVEGTNIGAQINKKQIIASLPSQGENIYTTLKPRFNALVKRADGLTAEQINSELQAILSEDAKIRQELDPTLFQQDIKKKKASATQNIINLSDPAKQAQALSENSGRYTQNKNVSESFEVATRFNNFVDAYNNPAAAGASDAVLIYSLAKMLDPGGAVQQGDIGTIAGQKSIPDKLKSIHQQFLNSRSLSDDQRKDLNAVAYSLMQNKRNSLKPTIKQYRNYAASFQSPDPTVDIQDPFDSIKLPKDRIVTINGKRTTLRLGVDPNGVQGYYYTAPNGKTYPYQD
jgi:hypothetical protein